MGINIVGNSQLEYVLIEFYKLLLTDPIHSWIFREKVNDVQKEKFLDLAYENAGYFYAPDGDFIYKFNDSITTSPIWSSYWCTGLDVNLESDFEVIGIKYSPKRAIFKHQQFTNRSIDRWETRSMIDPTFDDRVLGYLEFVFEESKQHEFENYLTINQLIKMLILCLLEPTSNLSSIKIQILNSQIELLLRISGFSNSPKHYRLFQPLLSLVDLRVTSHGVSRSFAQYETDSVLVLLTQVSKFLICLNRSGIHAFIGYGTLLGKTREENLLEHDSDVDLIILMGEESKRNPNEFIRLVSLAADAANLNLSNFTSHSISQQVSFFCYEKGVSEFNGKPQVTGFEFWIAQKTNDENDRYHIQFADKSIESSVLLPVKFDDFLGYAICTPNKPEQLLTAIYGKFWNEKLVFYKPDLRAVYE